MAATGGIICAVLLTGCARETPQSAPLTEAATPPRDSSGLGTSRETEALTVTPFPSDVAFSPDSRFLAWLQGRAHRDGDQGPRLSDLILARVSDGRVLTRRTVLEGATRHITWARDGSRVALTGQNAQMWRVDANGQLRLIASFAEPLKVRSSGESANGIPRESVPVITPGVLPIASALLPGQNLGARLKSSRPDRIAAPIQLELFDPRTEKVRHRANVAPGYPSYLDDVRFWPSPAATPRVLVPQSRHDGYRMGDVRLQMWNAATGTRMWDVGARGYEMITLPGRNGQDVIAGRVTGSQGRELYPLHETWQLDARTGKLLRKLPTQHTVYSLSSAGTRLLSYGVEPDGGARSLRWIDLQSGRALWTKRSPSNGYKELLALSPDGRTVAMVDTDGARLFSLQSVERGTAAPKLLRAMPGDEPE